MPPLNLFLQLTISVAVLIAANVATHRLAKNSTPRQILRTARDAVGVTDIFLGNSMVQAAVDESVMAKARPGSRPLNIGLGCSSPVEHYLLFRQQTNHPGATVYYGYSNTQLTDPVTGNWATLVGNRAMSYYVEPDIARGFYTSGSLVWELFFQACSRVPMVVERYGIWGRVERLRRWLGALGLPLQESNRFGRAEDFNHLTLSDTNFVSQCERAVTGNMPLSAPLSALFGDIRSSGRRLCVIEMPITKQYRELYHRLPAWKAYKNHIRNLVSRYGADHIEASDWVDDSGFSDVIHLNKQGAAVFSERMAKWASGQ